MTSQPKGITKDEVQSIAKLARLGLTTVEIKSATKDLADVYK